MRSARMLLATATATAALAIAAPVAYANATWDHDDHSYSKEHDKDGRHESPHGGMHTGGGALTAVDADDWGTARDPKHDPETYRSKDGGSSSDSYGGKQERDSWSGKDGHDSGGGKEDRDSWGSDHGKPHGGMHTGGGALASPGVTAGGLAVLAVAGTGMYVLRRKKVAEGVA
jgi:hypothetical protein